MTISAPAPDSLSDLAAGKHSFADVLKAAKNPIVLVGAGALARHDGAAVLALAAKLALDFGAVKDGWNGFGVLHDTRLARRRARYRLRAGRGRPERGADDRRSATLDVLFLLGADEIKVADGTFVVYIGTHGDRGAHRADVILPGAAYTEKHGLYVNTEGRVQMANRAAFPPGEAREDWAIIRALSEVIGNEAALRLACGIAAGDLQGRAAFDARRPDRSRQRRPISRRSRARWRQRREGAVQGHRSRIIT